ncbi:MAG: hypothetical protein EOP06_04180 [Proteobacteria bacterium]|nr:MAG: hypothetical protein EOP06_04180 [Pseudomonadota bacterium]
MKLQSMPDDINLRHYPKVDPETRQKKIAVYARTSSVKQENEKSIDAQVEACTRFAEELARAEGCSIVETFIDPSYSLEYKDPKAGIWRMIEAIKLGKVNTVIVYDQTRFLRSQDQTLVTEIRLVFQDFKIVTISPSNNRKTWLRSENLPNLVISALPSEDKNKFLTTVIQKRMDNARQFGRYRSTCPAYGYRLHVNPSKKMKRTKEAYTYVPDQTEALVVRDIFLLFCDREPEFLKVPDEYRFGRRTVSMIQKILVYNEVIHGSLRADYINHVGALWAEGFGTQGPKEKWNVSGIRYILSNRTYTGKLFLVFDMENKFAGSELQDLNIRVNRKRSIKYGEDGRTQKRHMKNEEIPLQHTEIELPMIVDEDLFLAAQVKRKAVKQSPGGKHSDKWHVGTVFCSSCGGPLKISTKKARNLPPVSYLRCLKGHESYRYDELVDVVVETVAQKLKTNSLDRMLKELEAAKSDAPKVARFTDSKLSKVRKELEALESEKARYDRDYKNGDLPARRYSEMADKVETSIEHKRLELLGAEEKDEQSSVSQMLRQKVDLINRLKALLVNKTYIERIMQNKQIFLDFIAPYLRKVSFSTVMVTDEEILRAYAADKRKIQDMIERNLLTIPKLSEVTGVSMYHLRQTFWAKQRGRSKERSILEANVRLTFEPDVFESPARPLLEIKS